MRVEVSPIRGLPGFDIVGMPEAGIRESRVRVLAALRNSGFELPEQRFVVNLAPADLRKTGSSFDLAIAIALLAQCGLCAPNLLRRDVDHRRAVAGRADAAGARAARASAERAAARAACGADPARRARAGRACARASTCAAPSTCATRWRSSAASVHLPGPARARTPSRPPRRARGPARRARPAGGQARARGRRGGRARPADDRPAGRGQDACSRGGCRASCRRRRRRGARDRDDRRAPAGCATRARAARERPFRAPHHSCSDVALIGGGDPIRPGEVTLAHGGVLFLDELPEFRRAALEALRPTMESGVAVIVRARDRVFMPASR